MHRNKLLKNTICIFFEPGTKENGKFKGVLEIHVSKNY